MIIHDLVGYSRERVGKSKRTVTREIINQL